VAKTYRVGVIGFAHMHINELMRQFGAVPSVQWVACADTVPSVPEKVVARFTRDWNKQHAHDDIGIPKVYDDYREMLEKESFDIVLFCPENARHGEVGTAIAAKGAHLVTEKPMAARLSDAKAMVQAAEKNGVKLMVNWPSTWQPAVRKMKELIDEGAIGRVLEVKCRFGSLGPLSHGSTHPGIDGRAVAMSDEEKGATWWHQAGTGGGALLDYCCYGACLSRWYIGKQAQAAYGFTTNLNSRYGAAEDNAVITARFPDAMALLEATWSCVDHAQPTGPIVYGETGTLSNEKGAVRLSRGRDSEAQLIQPDPLPAGRSTLAEEFIHHLETGEPLHPTLDPAFNLQAQAILDAGIRSAESGQLVQVEQF
jgi:predicted dehydrogenase